MLCKGLSYQMSLLWCCHERDGNPSQRSYANVNNVCHVCFSINSIKQTARQLCIWRNGPGMLSILFCHYTEAVMTPSVCLAVTLPLYLMDCARRLFSIQYIPRNMHTVFALLCFVVVIHWLIFPYPSGLLQWHCGNLMIAPVPAKQPWWIWINTSCEFIMNDCITTTKQSTTKPCAYFLGYTVHRAMGFALN